MKIPGEELDSKEMSLVHLLDDNPTTEDSLGFSRTADAIVGAVKNASRRPLTIGVFGGWGTGKTSLMQMIESRLKRDGIKTVWFNAWKYSGKEVIWNALIQTILLTMKNDADFMETSRRDAFRRRLFIISEALGKYAAKVGTRLIPGGIIQEGDVDDLWAALSSSVKDGSLFEFINRFESEFGRLVDEYVGESYLVVFIDDLDRCLPENAIEVMEALKLYLDKANCVFVIGVEPSIIQGAIVLRYGANSTLSASMYLEKIVQVPVLVPRVRTQSAVDLLSSVISDFGPDQQAHLYQLVRIGMDRNPRRIKRIVNSCMVALSIARQSSAEEKLPSAEEMLTLVKVLVIQMRFPEFYRQLARHSDLLDELGNAESEDAWSEAGVGRLYRDPELRDFLKVTKGIPAPGELVRRWIRVTETGTTE
jgi:hypothetical protein